MLTRVEASEGFITLVDAVKLNMNVPHLAGKRAPRTRNSFCCKRQWTSCCPSCEICRSRGRGCVELLLFVLLCTIDQRDSHLPCVTTEMSIKTARLTTAGLFGSRVQASIAGC